MRRGRQEGKYIFYLFNGEVGICRYADFLGLDIYDDEERVWCVAFEQLIYLEIRGSKFGAGVVPSYQLFAGVDFLKHVVHAFNIVVVKEPY